jgi:Tetratricopeptide repeat/Peptidase_C39 like family
VGRLVARLGLVALVLPTAGCATRIPRSQAPSPQATVVSAVPVRSFGEDLCGPGSLAVVLNTLGDTVRPEELEAELPKAKRGGVLSVDLLLAARQRGFDGGLVAGDGDDLRSEVAAGRPSIVMLRLLDAPGAGKDVYHYSVVDGFDPGRQLFRFQLGDGEARWIPLQKLEKSWAGAGHALLLVRPKAATVLDLHRAVGLEEAGRLDEAVALYRSVLAVRPDSALAWTDLGNAELKRRRLADAEKAYREALRIAPDDPDALNNLAWLLLEKAGLLDEAEDLAARAAALPGPGPDRAQALDTLARIQLARGRCEAAMASFTSALAVEGIPDLARAELERGLRDSRSACGPPNGAARDR